MNKGLNKCLAKELDDYKFIVIYALNEQDKLSESNYLKDMYKNHYILNDDAKMWYQFIWKTFPINYSKNKNISETEYIKASKFQLDIAKKSIDYIMHKKYHTIWLDNYRYYWECMKGYNKYIDPSIDQRIVLNAHQSNHDKYIRDSIKYFGYILDISSHI